LNTKYYPQIDSLRAIAVLLVIFFHFKIPFFDNGFIGVDIFFTISGFLMTKIIIEKQNFSFANFYKRRIFRLIPSLFTVIFVTLCFGTFFLPSYYLNDLFYSAFFSVFASSNFFFYSIDGYFSTSSEFKPLLHIWSLSLEEQFYFIFPFLLIFFNKKVSLSFLLICISVLSFIILDNVNFDLEKDSASFFWLPFRMYQFSIGSLGYYLLRSKLNSIVYKYFLLKKILILFSFIFLTLISSNFLNNFSLNQFFLGLISSLSAVFIIICTSTTNKVMMNNFLRYIGKISYSLYLVHWPIWVFTYDINDQFLRIIFAFILTAILGITLFYLIEKKMRLN